MGSKCPTCGREFSGQRGMRVHHAQVHGERLPNRECAECGSQFYSEEERKYCSDSCRDANVSYAGSANPNYRGGKTETTCDICDTAFKYYPSDKEGLYCQQCVEEENWRHDPNIRGEENPRWKGGPVELSCDNCDAPFERRPSVINSEVTFCSPECQAEWLSDEFTGDGHPNWKGGGSENYGPSWARARKRTLERDGHRCVVCGATHEELGRNPDVHHLVAVRRFVEHEATTVADAHTLDNLVSLCPSCHRRVEFGRVSATDLRRLAVPEP